MVIFHLKPSYLNWRVIPCKRRKSCIYAIFFFDIFLNLAFLIFVWIRSNFSSAWYDNQFFFFAFIIFFPPCLLRATTHTIDGFSGWSTISHVGIVLKGSSFGQRVVHVIFVQRKNYGSKVLLRNGQFSFWSTCSKTSINDDFEILWSWELCFWLSKKELTDLKL